MVAGAWEGPIGLRRVPREKGMLLLPLSPDSGEPGLESKLEAYS